MIKAVLFDLDNTLTDRELSIRAIGDRMWKDFGPFACGRHDFVAVLLETDGQGYRPRSEMFHDLVHRVGWEGAPEAPLLVEYWRDTFAACCQPREGLHDLLEHLHHEGMKLGIVSNGRGDIQRRKLETLKLSEAFATVVISEEAGISKPEPAIFNLALDNLGVGAEEAVFVGDDPSRISLQPTR